MFESTAEDENAQVINMERIFRSSKKSYFIRAVDNEIRKENQLIQRLKSQLKASNEKQNYEKQPTHCYNYRQASRKPKNHILPWSHIATPNLGRTSTTAMPVFLNRKASTNKREERQKNSSGQWVNKLWIYGEKPKWKNFQSYRQLRKPSVSLH